MPRTKRSIRLSHPAVPIRLTVWAATASLFAATTPALAQAQSSAASADPRYRIEIVVYSLLDADRGEEDFRHGRPPGPPMPAPTRYRLPLLEIESLLEPFAPAFPGAGTEGLPPASDSGPGEPSEAARLEAAGREPSDAGRAGSTGATQSGGALVGGDRLELVELGSARLPTARNPSAGRPGLPDAFRILRSDELELTEDVAGLRRSRPYRVIRHVGWEQTGVDLTRAVPVDLAALGITNPTGTILFHIGRFRHVIVDLVYRDGSGSLWTADPGPGLAPLAYAESYSWRQEAEAITGLYNVDHPLFGMLIWITRAPESGAEAPPADATAPGGPAA